MRSRSSRRRIEWLSADAETPSLAAARVKLLSSATTANAARLPQSSRSIAENFSMPHPDCMSLSQLYGVASSSRQLGSSFFFARGQNAEAQTWKEQSRSVGDRTRLHGTELRLWTRCGQAGRNQADSVGGRAWRDVL